MTQVRVFHRVHVNHRPISAPGWRVRGAAGPAPAPLAPASARLRQLLCSPNFTTASCASFSVPPTLLLHGLRFTRTHARTRHTGRACWQGWPSGSSSNSTTYPGCGFVPLKATTFQHRASPRPRARCLPWGKPVSSRGRCLGLRASAAS